MFERLPQYNDSLSGDNNVLLISVLCAALGMEGGYEKMPTAFAEFVWADLTTPRTVKRAYFLAPSTRIATCTTVNTVRTHYAG